MSLRARLLAAFAYALLVVMVALMVPLASNLDDRVNAEVEADSAAQAQIVAASVADQMNRPARLQQVSAEASEQLGGRVFIVDGRGRLLADSSGQSRLGTSVFADEEHPPLLEALDGGIGQGTHPPTWTCSRPPCRSSATSARSAPWRSSRASRRSTTRFATTSRP